jgi:hypothetical protein
VRRKLFGYSKRRITLWTIFYGGLLAIIVGAVIFTKNNLLNRTVDIDGQVTVTTSKQRYELDEEIQFGIVNDSGSAIKIDNDCPQEPLIVYRWNKSSWERVHSYVSSSVCPNQDRQIAIGPHSSLSGSYKNWMDLFKEPAIYRIATSVDGYAGLAYQDIEVLSPVSVDTPAATPAPEQPTLDQNSITVEQPTTKTNTSHEREEERHEENESDD